MRAWLLLFVLLAPLAGAADPNPRSPALVADAVITSLAVAREPIATSGAVTVGTVDPAQGNPTGRLTAPGGDAWFLWDATGRQLLDAPLDRDGCGTSAPEDDCISNAIAVAISRDGRRLAALSAIDPQTLPPPGSPTSPPDTDRSLLTLATADGGVLVRRELAHAGRHLAIAADGNRIAVLLAEAATPTTFRGNVTVFDWPASGTLLAPVMTRSLDADAHQIAIASNGGSIAVAGAKYWAFPSVAAAAAPQTVNAAANAVAIGGVGPYWTVVGFANDDIRLYRSLSGGHNDTGSHMDAGDPITSVALAADLRLYVAGDDEGRLHFHNLSTGATTRHGRFVASVDVAEAPIADLTLSSDGRVVAFRAGRTAHMLHWDGRVLLPLWQFTADADTSGFAMTANGESAVLAYGVRATVLEAKHDLRLVAPPDLRVLPGEETVLDLRLRNEGNRVERFVLSATAPAGWTVGVSEVGEVSLVPGQERTFQLAVEVPSRAAPGRHAVHVNHTLAVGPPGGTRLELDVAMKTSLLLESTNARSLPLEPGAAVDFEFTVRNDGNTPATATLASEAPPAGWRFDLDASRLDLHPGESADVTATLQAPAQAAQGAAATVGVTIREAPLQELRFTATVGGRFAVDLEAPSGLTVRRNNETPVTYAVTNQGNAPDSYTLTLGAAPQQWLFLFADGSSHAFLADVLPAETRRIDVFVQAPGNAANDGQFLLGAVVESRAVPTVRDTHSMIVTVTDRGADGCPRGERRNSAGDCVKDSPGPAGALLLATLVALAWAGSRRRR